MATYVDGKLQPQTQTSLDVATVKNHHHNHEHWVGGSATEDSLTAYTADSGDGAFGTEVVVFGASDTPISAGNIRFDARRVLVATMQHTTPYVFQLVWGSGSFADAVSAGQTSSAMLIKSSATGAGQGGPVEIIMPQLLSGIDKLWVRVKNATNTSTLTFYLGIHEYEE